MPHPPSSATRLSKLIQALVDNLPTFNEATVAQMRLTVRPSGLPVQINNDHTPIMPLPPGQERIDRQIDVQLFDKVTIDGRDLVFNESGTFALVHDDVNTLTLYDLHAPTYQPPLVIPTPFDLVKGYNYQQLSHVILGDLHRYLVGRFLATLFSTPDAYSQIMSQKMNPNYQILFPIIRSLEKKLRDDQQEYSVAKSLIGSTYSLLATDEKNRSTFSSITLVKETNRQYIRVVMGENIADFDLNAVDVNKNTEG